MIPLSGTYCTSIIVYDLQSQLKLLFFRLTPYCIQHLWHRCRFELVQHCLINLFCCCHLVWITVDSSTHPRRNKCFGVTYRLHSSVLLQNGCLDDHHHTSSHIFSCCLCSFCCYQHSHICISPRPNTG